VQSATSIFAVEGATVRRTSYVDEDNDSGITVYASDTNLPETLSAAMAAGSFLKEATKAFPTVVLGAVAAQRLGVSDVRDRPQVWIGDRYYRVVGILGTVTLDSGIDRAALIGLPEAQARFDADATPAKVYVRVEDHRIDSVRDALAGTANPENPEEVSVSRPSDALEARAAAEGAFTSLFLGLGAVALLVGGVGIANVMVISVLERRSEIGLRRALGATRRHISTQFLTESILLSGGGGVGGVLLGIAGTAIYTVTQGQATVVPPAAIGAGIGSAVAIGAVAGLYPSLRASRLPPTEALRAV
jgi:putative ABC transport system permease protein